MKIQKAKSEILSFCIEDAEMMKKAIENVSKRTYISNNSISFDDQGQMLIEDTRASFLLNIGIEFGKLMNNTCPICHSKIDWK